MNSMTLNILVLVVRINILNFSSCFYFCIILSNLIMGLDYVENYLFFIFPPFLNVFLYLYFRLLLFSYVVNYSKYTGGGPFIVNFLFCLWMKCFELERMLKLVLKSLMEFMILSSIVFLLYKFLLFSKIFYCF